MEDENSDTSKECVYPVLIIPKVCTTLESNCEISQNVFIHLNIQSPDAEGNQNVIYNGLCNIKLAEVNDNINIRYCPTNNQASNDNIPVTLTEANHITFPSFKESQVWIDPSKSPYVYNQCDESPLETYTITEGAENHITIEQHNTYITQNVYKYNEKSRYSLISDEEKEDINITEVAQTSDNYDGYEDEELECGVFLSQLSEDIIQEKETWARDERKFSALETDNEALKQLMSKNIQSASKQQKTILYLGHDAESGQTVQNISINDPMLECIVNGHVDNEVVIDGSNTPNGHPRKKYQCNKCKQLFEHIITFKQHMVGSHRSYSPFSDVSKNIRFMCTECGKQLKNRDKLEQHYLGHGDPELECNRCHKVFASKFTLRAHRKIHTRLFPCQHCKRAYDTSSELYTHKAKAHNMFICEICAVTCENFPNLISHQEDVHKVKHSNKTSSDADISESLFGEASSDISEDIVICESKTQEADLVIAKIKSNRIFHFNGKKKQRINDKTCDVCYKKFDRLSDLKRHLIEHVIRSTLSKNPVNSFGVLNIRCEICQEKVFATVDKYKAHLREHAKLTLYKCTFCDKSFSDSSNFSKHKKIHGTTFYQCDICQRKFNSKKMITQHMDYHNKNRPLYCKYCSKEFYFHSTLNKHIKCSHVKESRSKYKCRFCPDILNCLKEKWDHEWTVHHVRKAIVDCLFCGSRFRKYAELKKHCSEKHNTMIPPANRLLRWKRKNKAQMIESD